EPPPVSFRLHRPYDDRLVPTTRPRCRSSSRRTEGAYLRQGRSEPVSRVLYPCGRRSFLLAGRLLAGSSDHTRGIMSGPLTLLFGLAPGGVWHARAITRAPVGSYPTISPLPLWGGLFSVPLSADRSAPPLTATLPLWSPDFPLSLRKAIA